MNKKVLLLIGLMLATFSYGQQLATYSNFLMNEFYYNPAVAGSKDYHLANLSYRNQWTGFEDAPVNFNANIFGSLHNKGKIGYGLGFINQRAGITNQTGIYLNYAQHFKLNDKLKLGLGIQPGYLMNRIRLYDAKMADAGDEVLTGSVYSANAIDINMGFQLYGNKFFIAGSVQHLLTNSIQFTSYNSNLSFHYTALGAYTFELPKKRLELQPAFLIRYVNPVPLQWTGMLKLTYDKKIWASLLFRSDDAAGISIGVTIKKWLTLAYGYDISLSGIRKYNGGSHEIMLSYILTHKKPTLEEEDDKLNNSILEEMKKKEEEEKNKQKQESADHE